MPISAIRDIFVAHFKKNNQTTDNLFVSSLVEELCKSNALSTALSAGGPLSSSFTRQQHYKQKFKVAEPVEYILEPNEKRSFQYVPILQSSSNKYESNCDGTIYKEN